MTSYPPTPSSREEYYYVTPSADPAKKKRVRPIAIVEEDELLVEIKAAALNPCDIQMVRRLPARRLQQLELLTRDRGRLPSRFEQANWWIWRWTNTRGFKGLGEDYSGVVKQAGARALTTHPHLTPGTPVFGLHFAPGAPDGTLSTHLTVKPAAHPCILPLPTDRLSFVEAASIPLVWLTAYTSLVEYGLLDRSPTASNARRSVVVVGASGGTGAYGVQIAKRLLGVGRVVGVCSGANEAFVRSLGADDVVAYDREDVVEGLKRRRPEGGFDVVVDNVGGTDVWQAIGQLASADGGGFVTIVGECASLY